MSRYAIFRVALGMRRHRGPDSIGGWRIVEQTGTVVRLRRAGRRVAGEIVLVTADERVHLGLALRDLSSAGALGWRRLMPVHHKMAVRLLQGAAEIGAGEQSTY